MIIQICVGSSCHIKGSERIVELCRESVEKHHLENEVTLAGSFCVGKCNQIGVTIQVDDDVYTGVTPETFENFFEENILAKLQQESE